ncbi:hypothetical protein J5X91_10875 [Pseudoalteromonas sp. K222D]|uniref:hypothetical protein n=1 Tax=Pseudoalteromonas sp. K222D TaxID=2820756 RepID=UPI001AD7031F|nr:hypothetical protein [Pseudoalteromonas sp. K222D]MBO7926765.1 hypothetical protein [Pseudoalteromonas sp. K222D]
MKFIGWIPNLRGRLSFNTIGSSTKPYPFTKFTEASHNVVSQSNRKLNDSAVPRSIRKFFFEFKFSPLRLLSKFNSTIEKLSYHSGEFKFSFYYLDPKETEYHNPIKGYIIIEPNANLRSQTCDIDITSHKLLQDMNINGLQHMLDRSLVVTEVQIDRDGFCELTSLYVRKIERSKLMWTSSVQDGFNQFIEEAIHQAYYFIKDVCHQHQHHDSKTDNLLPLVKFRNGNINRAYEELSIKIFKSLYRLVLKKRRSDRVKDYNSMKGILCYLKSFRSIVSKRKISVENFQTEDDYFLSGSIEARGNCISADRERKKSFIGMIPSIISLSVSLLALLFAFSSMVIIYSNNITIRDEKLREISESSLSSYYNIIQVVMSYPLEFFSGILAISFAFFFVCSDLFKESRFYNDFWRIVYGFESQKTVGLLTMLCAVFLMYKSTGMIEKQFQVFIVDILQSGLNSISKYTLGITERIFK